MTTRPLSRSSTCRPDTVAVIGTVPGLITRTGTVAVWPGTSETGSGGTETARNASPPAPVGAAAGATTVGDVAAEAGPATVVRIAATAMTAAKSRATIRGAWGLGKACCRIGQV